MLDCFIQHTDRYQSTIMEHRVEELYSRMENNAKADGKRRGRKVAGYNVRVLLPLPFCLETISDIHLLRGSTPRTKRYGTSRDSARVAAFVYESHNEEEAARCRPAEGGRSQDKEIHTRRRKEALERDCTQNPCIWNPVVRLKRVDIKRAKNM